MATKLNKQALSHARRLVVISLESRAAQHGHEDIADAARKLLEEIDAD